MINTSLHMYWALFSLIDNVISGVIPTISKEHSEPEHVMLDIPDLNCFLKQAKPQ